VKRISTITIMSSRFGIVPDRNGQTLERLEWRSCDSKHSPARIRIGQFAAVTGDARWRNVNVINIISASYWVQWTCAKMNRAA